MRDVPRQILRSPLTTLVLVALSTVLLIHVAAVRLESLRVDLTEDRLYSLSDGTRQILEKMRAEGVQPVQVELYFSDTVGKTLPSFIKTFVTYRDYLETLLRELEVASDGKLEVSVIDPLPDSDAAEKARDYGLEGQAVNQQGDQFFFGLVFETRTGSRDAIPFLWPSRQETVEYEIVKTLYHLLWPSRQRVGVLSSLDVLGPENPYMAQILRAQGKDPGRTWTSMELLRESYEVRKIPVTTDRIPREEIDLLVVIHPKNLGARALWAIDEWVQRGGNTLVFVDPYAIEDRPDVDPSNPQAQMQVFQHDPSSDLEPLLRSWGVDRLPHRVAADLELAVKRQTSARSPAARVVVDLRIDSQTRDQTLAEHPVLRGLSELRFFAAGALVQSGEADDAYDRDEVEREALLTTTAAGNTLDMRPGFPGGSQLTFASLGQPARLADAFRPGDEPVALAYVLRGPLPTAYPEGTQIPAEPPPPPPPGLPPGLPPGIDVPADPNAETKRVEPVPEDERSEATVMVFADVDFISDPIAFQNTVLGAVALNDNHKVLLNAVDYLLGSDELMRVRAKKPVRRPFVLFDRIEQQADAAGLEREKELRAEIERFEEELREKQSRAGNVALLKKQVRDEVNELNRRIEEAEDELRQIRRQKRAALEVEEARVRFAVMGAMPILVLCLGVGLFLRHKVRDRRARAGLDDLEETEEQS